MITGIVTADREAVLKLVVYNANGHSQQIEAIVDTGFTGWLTLPPLLIASLGLRWKRLGRCVLADGSTITNNVYEAIVLWGGQPVSIFVDEADANSLVGMSLMYGYELLMPIVDGGVFTLRRMSNP